ncbi:MAG TPA: phosphoesterase PA-phosphatase, partial [Chitinophagaceae bacterium]|nr:phosphoesterase PA-phosphatase [Chitinophagaceae bacterium]
MKKISGILFTVLCMAACKPNTEYLTVMHNPMLYYQTVKKLNDIVLENNFPPMIASRNYAYANIAAYEVMAAGDTNYNSLAGQLKHMPAMPKPVESANVDFPFASLIAFCRVGNAVTFPEGSMDVYVNELKEKAKDAGMPSKVFESSLQFADTVAKSVLNWSKADNYAQTRSAGRYTVTNEPGTWTPTPPGYFQALEAHWHEIRPMLLDSAAQFMPPRPPKFEPQNTGSDYYKAVRDVEKLVDSLTEEQKTIADFWDDNPFKLNVVGHVQFATKKFSPPGHWMNIVGIVAQQQNADFATAVAIYTETSIAIFDGFISCWDEKYRSNYVRPVTVINKYFDPNWQP